MVEKDLKVGDLIKIMKITQGDENKAGYVDDMEKCIGRTFVITDFAGSCPGIIYNLGMRDTLYFDPRDVRRIRKVKPIVKEEKAVVVKDNLLSKLIQKCKDNGGVGLCSFAIQNADNEQQFHVRAPCHARLSYSIEGKPVLVANAMYDYRRLSTYPEAYTAYIKYIVQESPWSTIINEKDVEAILSSGCTLRTDVPLNNVLGACVALREGNEFPYHLPIFQDILNAGFSGHTAYVISRAFKGSLENPVYLKITNPHKVLSPDNWADGLSEFFIKGYDNGLRTSYEKGDRGYGISRYIASEAYKDTITDLIRKAEKVYVVKGPFGNENRLTYSKEGVLEVCQVFENMLNKWRAA